MFCESREHLQDLGNLEKVFDCAYSVGTFISLVFLKSANLAKIFYNRTQICIRCEFNRYPLPLFKTFFLQGELTVALRCAERYP
jgi:hypothetical protein